MANTGMAIATSVADIGGGDKAWTNITNALVDDTSAAACLSLAGTGDMTNSLEFHFGFSGLTGTIDGIEIKYRVLADTSNDMTDSIVQLTLSGSAIGPNKANFGTYYPITATSYTKGGTSNKWGLALTAADINDATFGVIIRCEDGGSGDGDSVWLEAVFCRVTYTPSAGGPTPEEMAAGFFMMMNN